MDGTHWLKVWLEDDTASVQVEVLMDSILKVFNFPHVCLLGIRVGGRVSFRARVRVRQGENESEGKKSVALRYPLEEAPLAKCRAGAVVGVERVEVERLVRRGTHARAAPLLGGDL